MTSLADINVSGRTPVKIYTLDNFATTVLVDATTTSQQVCLQVAKKIGFQNPDTTGTYFCL